MRKSISQNNAPTTLFLALRNPNTKIIQLVLRILTILIKESGKICHFCQQRNKFNFLITSFKDEIRQQLATSQLVHLKKLFDDQTEKIQDFSVDLLIEILNGLTSDESFELFVKLLSVNNPVVLMSVLTGLNQFVQIDKYKTTLLQQPDTRKILADIVKDPILDDTIKSQANAILMLRIVFNFLLFLLFEFFFLVSCRMEYSNHCNML